MAFPRIRMRWRLRTLMIVVAICAVGLVIHRINVERAPVYQLIRQLRTGNAQARSQAAVQLGLMGPKASFAAEALTSALDDPDPGVRTEATYALVEVGSRSPRLLNALVATLETPPMRWRQSPFMSWSPGHDPVAALKAIRPDPAVIIPMLKTLLKSPNPGAHRRAIDVLCLVAGWSDPSSPEVAEALLALLADDRFDTRKRAAEALAKRDRGTQERAVARLAGELRDLGTSRSFEASLLLPLFADGTPAAVATLLVQARGGDEIKRLIALYLLAQYGELATPAAPALMRIITERDADRRINLGLRMYWWKSFSAKGGETRFGRRFPDPNAQGEISTVALCVRALAAMGEAVQQRSIRELIAMIQDPEADDDRKRGAIVALGEFGPEAVEAIPVLVEVIRAREKVHRGTAPDAENDDDEAPLGAPATTALAEIGSDGNPEVVAILAGLLEANDAKVRNFAAIALERLGPTARPAIPALVKALESPDPIVRRWSAGALGKIGGPEVRAVLPALMAALDDEDRLVRTNAAEAIGPFGVAAKEAVPKIVRLLWECGPDHGIAKSLGQIGPDAAVAVPPLIVHLDSAHPTTRDEINAALDRIVPRVAGTTILGSIAALASSDPTGRLRAVYELGRLSEGRPGPAGGAITRAGSLVGAVALGEALGDPDPLVRRMAAAMLARLGPSAALAGPALIRATRDPDESIRKLAASALGRAAAGMSGAIPTLADLMKDPSGEVRRWVAGVLGSLGARAAPAAPAMIAALEGQDIPVRVSILTALGQLSRSGGVVIPTLLEALDDPLEEIRAAAASSLGSFIDSRPDAVMPAMLKALGDPSEYVRYRVSGMLGSSRPSPLVLPPLIERLVQGEPLARAAAADALGDRSFAGPNEPETIRRVVAALAAALTDHDPRVRASAARALTWFGGAAEPAERALRAAMDDPSRRVRDNASAALRAIAEDRARR